MNELPVPRWDLLKLERYFKPIPTLKMPIMSIQTSRGCPHKCDFCTVPVFAGGKMRYRDPAHLLREIDAYGAEFFSIADDNLIVNPDAAAQLFKTLAKRKLSWFGFLTPRRSSGRNWLNWPPGPAAAGPFWASKASTRTSWPQ